MPRISTLYATRQSQGDEAAAAMILDAIKAAKGSKTKAAEKLEIGHNAFYKMINELRLHERIDKLLEDNGFKVARGTERKELPPLPKKRRRAS